MSDIPVHLKYSDSNCWVELLGDDTARVGITDHAQQQLGSVIFIDLPEKGRIFSQIEECLQIESIDTTTGVYCPLTGEIIDVNFDLEENPELINIDPYGSGWLFIIRHNNRQAGKGLMNAEEYSGIIS